MRKYLLRLNSSMVRLDRSWNLFYVRDTENLLEKAGKMNVLEIVRAFSVTKFKIDLQIHFWVNSLLLASSAYS